MLQSLLEERFQVSFHREQREQTVYSLVVNGKHRMTSADPGTRRGNRMDLSDPTGNVRMEITNTPMDRLAAMLTVELKAIVKDNTGLSGGFTFGLDLSREAAILPPMAPALPQVGLKVESRKAPVDFIVVDRAEKPGEN